MRDAERILRQVIYRNTRLSRLPTRGAVLVALTAGRHVVALGNARWSPGDQLALGGFMKFAVNDQGRPMISGCMNPASLASRVAVARD